MTTLREAAAMALEALEYGHFAVADQAPHADVMAYLEATDKLREALAEPEQEPVGEVVIQDTRYHGYAMAIKPHIQGALPEGTNLYTYPPLLPAKPVGWLRVIDEAMVVHHCGVADPSDDYETAKRKLNTLLCIAQDIGSYFASQQHPPQRKPLTDEEIAALLSQSAGVDVKLNSGDVLFARAIERAHGIRGEE